MLIITEDLYVVYVIHIVHIIDYNFNIKNAQHESNISIYKKFFWHGIHDNADNFHVITIDFLLHKCESNIHLPIFYL